MNTILENLQSSLYKGFIDQSLNKQASYTPKLLINNNKDNVLNTLLEELEVCRTFLFSVAFITESGLATLKTALLDLKNKGINGRILTSTFLSFNNPKVFKELLKITNVEVRLSDLEGFHSKGYIFEKADCYSLIVGSSNLTAHALKVNHEWNVKLTSLENGEIIQHFKNQFEEVWKMSSPLTEDWIYQYEKNYIPQITKKATDQLSDFPIDYRVNSIEEALKIKPNKMQEAALNGIELIREAGLNKGLVISATGTGKTYLSAFDVRKFAPKKMLFVVHREQILQKAKSDFYKIMGGLDKEFGILSGNEKNTDAKYLFATIQSISKDNILNQFQPDDFDYILIDEVHKAGASSYIKMINYFKPKFFMGMTATPERTDDFNIFELFDYNIAYEIRLQEALEEDMLCSFHYFGVTDLEYNGELIEETTILSKLVTNERVEHLIDKINYYGHSGKKVKGLMFCSRKEEAIKLSNALNEKGYVTIALTGDDSQEDRILQVNKLENGLLDYIITVDIFNEGIDIPSVNQVVMLRQTQSSIIFIQQLGRGLRKHNSKDFVTIIDFIGNYKNNYMIPMALSGDKSLNKDNIRRTMKDTGYIKGVSTVNFEEIAKKQIFKSISNSNLSESKKIREAYIELKNRIGRSPSLHDLLIHNSIDPEVIIDKFSNLHKFREKIKEEVQILNEYEEKIITFISCEFLNGKRKHEIILLNLLLRKDYVTIEEYKEELTKYNCENVKTINSVKRIFELSFFGESSKKKYGNVPVVSYDQGKGFVLNVSIKRSLETNPYFLELFNDVIKTEFEKAKRYVSDREFTLYEKYTRKDACRLLNWDNDESSTIYGYKPKHNSCPIFVTYHKNDEIDSSIAYGDELLNQSVFRWFTRSNRSLQSEEVRKIIEAYKTGLEIHLFIKKDDDEGSDFYYLGKTSVDLNSVLQTTMKDKANKDIPVVRMDLVLETEVENKLYKYLISNEI